MASQAMKYLMRVVITACIMLACIIGGMWAFLHFKGWLPPEVAGPVFDLYLFPIVCLLIAGFISLVFYPVLQKQVEELKDAFFESFK